ncbi:hypothetical protein SAMN04489740_3222 [Arthrobacter alpinus]|uniref:Uncharacterized protein n=1 Tax=Arthrobacter alpinus TaxID=656366 RepID=A0A1H5MZM5_9MICC|nr:hypothetical protein SAMN04489740_3222 [Arthrobacter alpinus]
MAKDHVWSLRESLVLPFTATILLAPSSAATSLQTATLDDSTQRTQLNWFAPP